MSFLALVHSNFPLKQRIADEVADVQVRFAKLAGGKRVKRKRVKEKNKWELYFKNSKTSTDVLKDNWFEWYEIELLF